MPKNVPNQAPRENVNAKDHNRNKNIPKIDARYCRLFFLKNIAVNMAGMATVKYPPNPLGVLKAAVGRPPGAILCPKKMSLCVT